MAQLFTSPIEFTERTLHHPAVAASGIYWTEPITGTVNHATLDGSDRAILVSGLTNPSGGMFVTDNEIYWTDRDDLAIWRSGVDGSGAGILISAPGSPRDVAVTEDAIYWVSTGSLDSVSNANLDGSNAAAVVTSDLSFPNGISLHEDKIYWSDSGPSPVTATIKASELDGTGINEIIGAIPTTLLPTDVFVTSEYIYWSTRDLELTRDGTAIPGTIQRAKLDGSEITKLIDGLVFPAQVVVTDRNVYWTESRAAGEGVGKIQRANLDGSGIIDLITGISSAGGLAVVTSAPELVMIDIKPVPDRRCVNQNPVVIFGSTDFRASDINVDSLVFDGQESDGHVPLCSLDYVNEDEHLDLICKFVPGTAEATLAGELLDGTLFKGTDTICAAQ